MLIDKRLSLTMRVARWITVVWPGLTQLWLAGAWWGLAIACGFAWLVNLAVVSTFVWTELIAPWSRVGVWILLVMVWAAAMVLSVRQLRSSNPEAEQATAEDLFRRASREYLNGNWIKAEQLLTHLIRLNGRDCDAQLMLASLLRRTGQLTEASGRLRRLEATDGAEKWRSEVARERQMLDGQFSKHQNVESEVTETPATKAA
jgi:hypothetical protein